MTTEDLTIVTREVERPGYSMSVDETADGHYCIGGELSWNLDLPRLTVIFHQPTRNPDLTLLAPLWRLRIVARRMGYGSLYITYIRPHYRGRNRTQRSPASIVTAARQYLEGALLVSEAIIVAWGKCTMSDTFRSELYRRLREMKKPVLCMGLMEGGHPFAAGHTTRRHPNDQVLQPFHSHLQGVAHRATP